MDGVDKAQLQIERTIGMTPSSSITTFFLDIGGVLLTNGWDHTIRAHAADKFSLDYEEMNERHHLTYDTYEEGKLSLDDYLNRVVFIKSARSHGKSSRRS
jgi:hypothetical protein